MPTLRASCLVLFFSSLLISATAQAQLLNAAKNAMGGMGGMSNGAAGMPSLSSVGTGNLTGVLTYCMKNKYLSGSEASGVQSQLLGKLGGASQAKSNPGYQQGLSGILGGDSGQKMDLTGGGNNTVKQRITDAACNRVLEYGKSMH